MTESTIHTIYAPLALPKSIKAQIAFIFAGVPFEEVEVAFDKLKTPEFLKKNPNGKVPVIETPNGKFIWESNAILRYIARLDKSRGLYGRDVVEEAQVDQWMDWFATNYEKDFYLAVSPHTGRNLQITKEEQKEALERLLTGFKVLESHLRLNTTLVGNRITIADISIAVMLNIAFRFVWDEKFRNKNIPNITRWYEYLINQEPFKKVYGKPVLCKKALDRSLFEDKAIKKEEAPKKK